MLLFNCEDKEVHNFPKGICPKVNVIAQLEFELANYDVTDHTCLRLRHEDSPIRIDGEVILSCYDFADHHFNHYTPGAFWLLSTTIANFTTFYIFL